MTNSHSTDKRERIKQKISEELKIDIGAPIAKATLRDVRDRAKIGAEVVWLEDKKLHRGIIKGKYPHVCEISERFAGAKITKCLLWQDLINKV